MAYINVFSYRNGINGMKVNLTDLILFKERDEYFMAATYRLEDKSSVRELHFPKIAVPLCTDRVALQNTLHGIDGDIIGTLDLGFGYVYAHQGGKDNVICTETVIEEKTHEMTLDEIEKKLGYKVKIINKKE